MRTGHALTALGFVAVALAACASEPSTPAAVTSTTGVATSKVPSTPATTTTFPSVMGPSATVRPG